MTSAFGCLGIKRLQYFVFCFFSSLKPHWVYKEEIIRSCFKTFNIIQIIVSWKYDSSWWQWGEKWSGRKDGRRGTCVFNCFLIFSLCPAASGAEGRTPETPMTVWIPTVGQGFVLCKACSHTFLFDSCNNTMSLISCHSPPQCNHSSFLLFLDHIKLLLALGLLHMLSPCLGMFSPPPAFPPSLLKYYSLRRCSPRLNYISLLVVLFSMCITYFFFMAVFINLVTYCLHVWTLVFLSK